MLGRMFSVKILLLSTAGGVAGAVAVVIFHGNATDVVAGALATVALVAVTLSAIQLAGEIGPPDDEPL
jgi:hypothetical protein